MNELNIINKISQNLNIIIFFDCYNWNINKKGVNIKNYVIKMELAELNL